MHNNNKQLHSKKLKIIVRNIPSTVTEDDFLKLEPVKQAVEKKIIDWHYFVKGMTYQPAIAYLHFVNQTDLFEFTQKLKVLANNQSNLNGIQVEYAPYQKISTIKAADDQRQGTIEKDDDFVSFLKQMEKPVEKMISADKQLEQQEDQERERPKEAKTTPLLDELKQLRMKARQNVQTIRLLVMHYVAITATEWTWQCSCRKARWQRC